MLRLRGGAGKEESSSADEEQRKTMPPPRKRLRRHRKNSKEWPDQLVGDQFEKKLQRPAPMNVPRQQDLEYGNMTTDIAREGQV